LVIPTLNWHNFFFRIFLILPVYTIMLKLNTHTHTHTICGEWRIRVPVPTYYINRINVKAKSTRYHVLLCIHGCDIHNIRTHITMYITYIYACMHISNKGREKTLAGVHIYEYTARRAVIYSTAFAKTALYLPGRFWGRRVGRRSHLVLHRPRYP